MGLVIGMKLVLVLGLLLPGLNPVSVPVLGLGFRSRDNVSGARPFQKDPESPGVPDSHVHLR